MNKRERALLNSLDALVAPVLAQRPKPRTDAPGLTARMVSADTAEIMIYGRIGGSFFEEGITSALIAARLREIGTARNVDVRINSGGGDYFEGVAIHTLLRRHPATVTVYVDGLAASAASVIMLAGDRVLVADGSMTMIHDAMCGPYGNSATLRREADLLDKVSEMISGLYADRAGEDADHWRGLMTVNGEDGTWFTATEAVECGLADELADPDDGAPASPATALKQWSAELERAPEKVRALLREQERTPEKEREQENAPETVDHSGPDAEHNAPESTDDSDDADRDFRFRMSMWQMQQHRAAA